jgi:hypothetical protein
MRNRRFGRENADDVALSFRSRRSLGAAEMNKPRLRQLAKLPTISVVVGFGFSTGDGFYLNDQKPDSAVENSSSARR